MKDIIKMARPIIVCGVPRSGTSLIRDLINAHQQVLVLDEFSIANSPSLLNLGQEIQTLMFNEYEEWRGASQDEMSIRMARLIAEVWATASRPSVYQRFRSGRFSRFGMKTPSAELFHKEYTQLLGLARPQYVYCTREPLSVYESLLSMPWGDKTEPEQAIAIYRQSYQAINNIREKDPSSILVFPVDSASQNYRVRLRLVIELFSFLGLQITPRVALFSLRWPAVNRRKSIAREGLLSDDEKRDRVNRFAALLGEDKNLEAFFQTANR